MLVNTGSNCHFAVLKCCIGKTVTEGECNLFGILCCIVTCVACAHNSVSKTCFVVLVAYVDTFLVYHVCGDSVGNCNAFLKEVFLSNVVNHCGRCEVVEAVCVNKATGGVNLTCKDISNCVCTCNTETANPQGSVNGVIVEEVYLKSVGCVDKNDNGLNLAFSLKVGSIFKECSLVSIELEVVLSSCITFVAGEGGVVAFTTNTGECNNNCIAVCGDGVFNVSGIISGVNFKDGSLTCKNCALTGGFTGGNCVHEFLSFIC